MPDWNVPGYTGLKKIGSGGFGEVMLARHDATGVLVAIKYLRHELSADPQFAGMFRAEAAALASVDDPNVVRLYEYVEAPPGAAIVMELIGGVSLREILALQGKTTAEAALMVLQGSLLGLAAAHRRDVVHRDYKPENVLVDGDGVSKLTDFGIAARTGDRPVPAGTLPYAAPEQMAGAPAAPASDVYAATATFYECLTGHPPFRGEAADLVRQHRFDPVPLQPVPEPLRHLIAAGMAKDPARRPADAITFVTELNTTASGAYGTHWQDHGRSHLAEAALLLAALWPSGAPPALQGAAVRRIPLRRRLQLRHFGAAKAAIAASVTIAAVAAGTALAATGSPRPAASNHPVAAVQSFSLQPSPAQSSLRQASAAQVSPTQISPSPSASSPPPAPAPAQASPDPAPAQATPTPTPTQASPSQTAPASAGPPATVCQPDGTGCTKAGTYQGPDVVINADYGGFKLVWTESVVQPYSSGVPLYWTAYVTYINVGSSTLTLRCQGDVTDLSSDQEHMSGGAGDDGSVAAASTTCSANPSWTEQVPPGGTAVAYSTFHNVPWPGTAVALQWSAAGTSPYAYPFG